MAHKIGYLSLCKHPSECKVKEILEQNEKMLVLYLELCDFRNII